MTKMSWRTQYGKNVFIPSSFIQIRYTVYLKYGALDESRKDQLCVFVCRREDSFPYLDRATKYNPMFESDLTTGYSHYYRRYPDPPIQSSGSAEASTDFSSEEIRHIYENSELTKEVRVQNYS